MSINNVSILPRYFGGYEPNESTEDPGSLSLDTVVTSECIQTLIYNLRQLSSVNQPSLLATIEIVYRTFIEEVADRERHQIFLAVVEQVKSADMNPVVLEAFIRHESNHILSSAAVGAYLQMKLAPENNLFAAAEDVIAILLEPKKPANRGAVYAGLVCFGDRRVCAIARTIRDTITAAEIRAFAVAVSSPLHRSSIEFCLSWLLDLVNRKKFELAIPVASALSSMMIKDSSQLVHDCVQNFGPYAFSSATVAPRQKYSEFLTELGPILDTISKAGQPALNQMIDIIREPGNSTLDQLERRKDSTRRIHMERRASDRRIVNLQPNRERRGLQRRGEQRRVGARR